MDDGDDALATATAVATELGFPVDDTIVLHRSNRLTARLVPCDLVARVAPSRWRAGQAFELDVARRLEAVGGPVGGPDPRVAPVVHERDGVAITFWRYHEPVPGDTAPADYAAALERLHTAMGRLDVAAPPFTDRVEQALNVVNDRSGSPDLGAADRALVRDALETRCAAVVERGAPRQLLHGEPHAGNLLRTASGLRFIDLETACLGPIEFDLAHAPDAVAQHAAGADPLLLRDCRILMLAMVAAWRSERDDRYPDGRRARADLLQQLRAAASPDAAAPGSHRRRRRPC